MNGKRAKEFRITARMTGWWYVGSKVLSEDQAKGLSADELFNVLPTHDYYRNAGQVFLGKMSQRWIYKQIKNKPDMTYSGLLKIAKVRVMTDEECRR